MLKFKGSGTKTVFDDDGQAHALYELQNENDFQQDGDAETQRQKFVDEEANRIREVDVEDKALAKSKRQEKKIKRKERERMENEGGDVETGGAEDTEYDREEALDFLRSLPTGNADREDEGSDERPRKKAKKWFQDDSDEEQEKKGKKGRGKVIEVTDEPDTLEDYEKLAAGLLD